MSNLIIGLTGGIGSGKSAAATRFMALGIDAIDADQAARDVVEPGEPALAAIAEHFGDALITAQGTLDRAALREKIFSNPAEKTWLESLLHPLIRQRISDFLSNAQSPYALLVSPLLLETNQNALVNKVIVVDVPEDTQVARTMSRDNNSEELVRSIMAAQATREKRLAGADYVLNNNGSLGDLTRQVDDLHQQLLVLAESSV